MIAHKVAIGILFGLPLVTLSGVSYAQQAADPAYVKKAMSAAPQQIARDATIVKMANGQMQTLKQGTNDFTCMVSPGGAMCLDKNAMDWAAAWQSHGTPPDKTGFMYMLAGDNGVSNTDPYATKPEASNHWIKTGPHVMVVGPGVKSMAGYPRSPDPNIKEPYVMWAGTPYEHLMLPVK